MKIQSGRPVLNSSFPTDFIESPDSENNQENGGCLQRYSST